MFKSDYNLNWINYITEINVGRDRVDGESRIIDTKAFLSPCDVVIKNDFDVMIIILSSSLHNDMNWNVGNSECLNWCNLNSVYICVNVMSELWIYMQYEYS